MDTQTGARPAEGYSFRVAALRKRIDQAREAIERGEVFEGMADSMGRTGAARERHLLWLLGELADEAEGYLNGDMS